MSKTLTQTKQYRSVRQKLADGRETTVHIVQVSGLRVELFDKPTKLLDWCELNEQPNAVNGGFFGTPENEAADGVSTCEVWIGGKKLSKSESKYDRGCLHIDQYGKISIELRSAYPVEIEGDLIEAGPILVKDGLAVKDYRSEGFSDEAELFDADITVGRAQRVAVATGRQSTWVVVSEGRSPEEAGLTLPELSDFLVEMGAGWALNLDGGSASSLVLDGKLINRPCMDKDKNYKAFPRGREIISALTLILE